MTAGGTRPVPDGAASLNWWIHGWQPPSGSRWPTASEYQGLTADSPAQANWLPRVCCGLTYRTKQWTRRRAASRKSGHRSGRETTAGRGQHTGSHEAGQRPTGLGR